MSHSMPSAAVLRHVVDVHCHPTDSSISPDSISRLQINICAMSTKQSDQPLVRQLAEDCPNVVPCFGYHPWFTHWIALSPAHSKEDHYRQLFQISSKDESEAFEKLLPTFPDPIALDDVLSDLRHNLQSFPLAMLGEVGLDSSFRIPIDFFASPREKTPLKIPIEHQLAILEAQLSVAVDLGRNVSFHSVNSQLITMQLFERMSRTYGDRWMNINVDIHSCGLSPQMWRDMETKHPNVYLSLSTIINSRSNNYKTLIAACSPSRILVESDIDNIDDCSGRTWDMLNIVAEIKGWHVEVEWEDDIEESQWGAVRKLYENWKTFQRQDKK